MNYTLNYGDLSAYNMRILSSSGLWDVPKRLGQTERMWNGVYDLQPYVNSDDLFWDSRIINLKAYYSGNHLTTDCEQLARSIEGSTVPLVTDLHTHAVKLKSIKPETIFKPDGQAIIIIELAEETVTPGTVMASIGGTGTTLDSYHFGNDFDLHVKSVSGLPELSFNERAISIYNMPGRITSIQTPRKVSISLNGYYNSVDSMDILIRKLTSVLMSSGTKLFAYNSKGYTTYFTDGLNIDYNLRRKTANMTLKLNIVE